MLYVFPEKELRSLSPNLHIHMAVYVKYSQAAQFLFWEKLFRILGIVSLQCTAHLMSSRGGVFLLLIMECSDDQQSHPA